MFLAEIAKEILFYRCFEEKLFINSFLIKPEIAPISNPMAPAAMMRYAPCKAVSQNSNVNIWLVPFIHRDHIFVGKHPWQMFPKSHVVPNYNS